MDANISNRFEKLREGVDANENDDAEEQEQESVSLSSSKRECRSRAAAWRWLRRAQFACRSQTTIDMYKPTPLCGFFFKILLNLQILINFYRRCRICHHREPKPWYRWRDPFDIRLIQLYAWINFTLNVAFHLSSLLSLHFSFPY